MIAPFMVMPKEDFDLISGFCHQLQEDTHARAVILLERSGQCIVSHGDICDVDTVSLASLAAGNVAATSAIAQILGEKEFPCILHEGERDKLHVGLIGQHAILVVVFDGRTSVGLVRLRVKRASEDLTTLVNAVVLNSEHVQRRGPLLGVTDEEIDNLFG